MRTSWADSVADSEAENAVSESTDNNKAGGDSVAERPTKPAYVSYVPPHMRNRQQPSNTAPPPAISDRPAYSGPSTGSRWGGPRADAGYGGGGRGGWNSPNPEYSHFISLPLAVHPELVKKLFRFQKSILGEDIEENEDDGSDENASKDDTKTQLSEKVPAVKVKLDLENYSDHVKVDTYIPPISYQPKSSQSKSVSDLGIDKSIFINPKTFHLTVLMLKLCNKERVHVAKEVLQSISTKVMDVLDGRPLSIRLKGLDCIRGSVAKACVLYAPVEEIGNEDRLVRACQVIIDAYIEAGLVLEKDVGHKLKLHATLMNVRHRQSKAMNKRRDYFDATGIFDKYGSEEWGEYHIREAHLSQRFVFDSSGYYHCCGSLPFPSSMPVE